MAWIRQNKKICIHNYNIIPSTLILVNPRSDLVSVSMISIVVLGPPYVKSTLSQAGFFH